MIHDEKLAVLILSSSKQLDTGIPVAIQQRLTETGRLEVTVWDQGMFRAGEVPLNSFLRELTSFDAAVLVLGSDDIRLSADTAGSEERQPVPSDNVVFELGACMSRFAMQGTFIVCPKSTKPVLPSYFHGFVTYTYEDVRSDDNKVAAVAPTCAKIAQSLDNQRASYYASLPAAGLAFGYFDNFVKPTFDGLRNGNPLSKVRLEDGTLQFEPYKPPSEQFSIYVVVPKRPINREAAELLFLSVGQDGAVDVGTTLLEESSRKRRRTLRFDKYRLRPITGRDLSFYANAGNESKEFRVYDVPTTLTTSTQAIEKIEGFWGGPDAKFRERLERRETVTFRRALPEVWRDRRISMPNVTVITMGEFETMAFK